MGRELYKADSMEEELDNSLWEAAVNETVHVIYVREFKRVSDVGERYVTETQRVAELQHLTVTQDLKKLFEDTQWTVEQLSFVAEIGVCRLMARAYIEV